MSNVKNNGKVVYVEPNLASDFTTYSSVNHGDVFKSVSLEDMCISVGLEVEVKGRTYRTSQIGGHNNIELNWQSSSNGQKISFMEGTTIPTSDGGSVKSLTTNYTDCHLFDIEGGGTAEMFGIKSIDISYDNFMVPVVTIQFVDVRGVSLFAQEEMRHHLRTQSGITGVADNSIEGSFFKCFFTFPYPRFVLKVKGFYGEMVSYELTCSDFRASFDSNTGNFNVTAKFVGYAFSFLGDVMVNCLTSAPYSEYIGKKYWDDNIENGRFYVLDRDGTPRKMPRLGEICKMYREIEERANKIIKGESAEEIAESESSDEKTKKAIVNSSIPDLKNEYNGLIGELREIHKMFLPSSKDGDVSINVGYSFVFITDGGEAEERLEECVEKFKEFNKKLINRQGDSDELKKWLNKHNFCINKYGSYDDLLDDNGSIKKNIISEEGLSTELKNKSKDEISEGKKYYEAWKDGYDSDVYVYQDFGLSDILAEGANENADDERDAAKAKRNHEIRILNKVFSQVFEFEPSVENITKIIMAHVETLIHMISVCSNNIIQSGTNRSVKNLGLKYEQVSDGGSNKTNGLTEETIVAPFPKLVTTIKEGDSVKSEEAWIGSLLTRDQAEEIKLVDGILNGVADIQDDISSAVLGKNQSPNINKSPLKYPLTYFDLFLESGDNPFGVADINDVNALFASFCVRAFSIFATQKYGGYQNPKMYGNADAENFIELYKNSTTFKTFGDIIESTDIDKVIDFITSEDNRIDKTKKHNPWYKVKTLVSENGNKYTLLPGYLGGKHSIFPIKNWSFNSIKNNAQINQDNPEYGLKTKNLRDYISTPVISDGKDSSFTFFIAEDVIPTLKARYSQLSESNYKDIVSDAFKSSNGFEFNIEKWDYAKYKNNKILINNENQRASISNTDAVKYSDDGSVNSIHDYALDFRNFFAEGCDKKDDIYKCAINFINSVFVDGNSYSDNLNSSPDYYTSIIKDFNKLNPCVLYHTKFAILKCAVLMMSDEKYNDGVRPSVVSKIQKYFEDWVDESYKNIHKKYSFKFKQGRDIKSLTDAIKSNETGDISDALSSNLTNSAEFKKIYSIEKNSGYKCGVLFRTLPCEEMTEILDDLLKIVGVCTTSIFNTTKDKYEGANGLNVSVSTDVIKSYLSGALDALKKYFQELRNGIESVEVRENSDEDDIKAGVYSYIKLLYDKWLASNSQDDFYKIENLFEGNNPVFHFLDSVYNNIGRSIYLNLTTLVDRIVQSQTSNGYTLLALLSGLYADNKFLFLCIQNFLDLSKDSMMDKMFRPIPYLECETPSNRPNFIVLMPYEPSSKLAVDGADYPDDGFYLNEDESTWPEMIREKSDGSIPIPAFGVTYGQQYQNYFKNIEVNMDAPMSTEQSIKAKFMIAGGNGDTEGVRTITAGQDLYTIYSNNSYTCTVTMMGCAWVQPMMYFVLQNVPMFKGSYMIVKVNHQITPGNMITTFKGIRMAKSTTRAVRNYIFGGIKDSTASYSGNQTTSNKQEAKYANIANDCEYAYYSPVNTNINLPSNADSAAYCYATYTILMKKANLTENQAKGVCANLYAESRFIPTMLTVDANSTSHAAGGGLASFYCKLGAKGEELFRYKYPNTWQREMKNLNDSVEYVWENNSKKSIDTRTKILAKSGKKFPISFEDQVSFLCYMINEGGYSKIREFKNVSEATDYWMNKFENPANKKQDRWKDYGNWVNNAISQQRQIYETKSDSAQSIDEIASGLTSSLNSSMSINMNYNQTSVTMKSLGGNMYEYKTSSTNPNATNALFDCMLSSYGNWFDSIEWNVGSGQSSDDAISVIVHIVSTTPPSHDITITHHEGNRKTVFLIIEEDNLNNSLRLILIKYFKSRNINDAGAIKSTFKSCVRMSEDKVKDIFEINDNKSIQKCDSVMGYQEASYKGSDSEKIMSYFDDKIPTSESDVKPYLADITYGNIKFKIHRDIKDSLNNALSEIRSTRFNISKIDGYSWRTVNNGSKSSKMSNHSYGLAIDINEGVHGNPFFNTHNLPTQETKALKDNQWSWPFVVDSKGNPISAYRGEYDGKKCIWYWEHPVVKIMNKYGFGWGGRYGDTMHFSVFNGD